MLNRYATFMPIKQNLKYFKKITVLYIYLHVNYFLSEPPQYLKIMFFNIFIINLNVYYANYVISLFMI